MRLDYVRGSGARDCPEEDFVRAGVAARLGYEPFDDRAEAHVTATVSRVGNALEARIEVADGAGRVRGERVLSSRRSDCTELAAAMELALAIAIDPLAGTGPAVKIVSPAPAPAPSPPPPPPIPAPPPQLGPPPAAVVLRTPASTPSGPRSPLVPTTFRASLGAVSSVGVAPAPAIGATLQAGIRRGALSAGLEGRADLPASAPLRTGMMKTSLLTGSLVPCWHRRILATCLLATVGAIRGSANGLVDAQHVTAPFVGVGARLALDIPIGDSVSLLLNGDVMAPLTQTVLRVSGEVVWTSPSICGALGLAVGVRFP